MEHNVEHGNQTHLLLYENIWWVDLALKMLNIKSNSMYLGEEEHGTHCIIHCRKNMEILVTRL